MGEHTATRGNVKWAEDSGENEQMATQWNARKHRGTGSERDTHTCYPEPGRYWLHFASPGNCWVFGRSADVEESGPAPVYAVRKHRAPTRTSGRSRARGFPFTASTAVWGSVRLHFGDDPSGKNPANPGNPPRLRPDPNSENPRNPGNPRAPARCAFAGRGRRRGDETNEINERTRLRALGVRARPLGLMARSRPGTATGAARVRSVGQSFAPAARRQQRGQHRKADYPGLNRVAQHR